MSTTRVLIDQFSTTDLLRPHTKHAYAPCRHYILNLSSYFKVYFRISCIIQVVAILTLGTILVSIHWSHAHSAQSSLFSSWKASLVRPTQVLWNHLSQPLSQQIPSSSSLTSYTIKQMEHAYCVVLIDPLFKLQKTKQMYNTISYITTSPTRVNFIVLFALLFTTLQVHHIIY